MAAADRLPEPILSILYLSTSEHLNIYINGIFGLQESDKYDLIRTKWVDFYQ